jgi:hypothetical protein
VACHVDRCSKSSAVCSTFVFEGTMLLKF